MRKERLTSLDGDVKEKFIATIFTELKVMHQFPCRFILPLMGMSYSEDMLTDPCLVYEYMPNGSVSDKLKRKNGSPALTWYDININQTLFLLNDSHIIKLFQFCNFTKKIISMFAKLKNYIFENFAKLQHELFFGKMKLNTNM